MELLNYLAVSSAMIRPELDGCVRFRVSDVVHVDSSDLMGLFGLFAHLVSGNFVFYFLTRSFGLKSCSVIGQRLGQVVMCSRDNSLKKLTRCLG